MKSEMPKVMHKVAGRSMLGHVLSAPPKRADKVAVVVGPDMAQVAAEAENMPGAEIFLQREQHGTADARPGGAPAIEAHSGDVIVLYADTPLIRPETIARLRAELDDGPRRVLGFRGEESNRLRPPADRRQRCLDCHSRR